MTTAATENQYRIKRLHVLTEFWCLRGIWGSQGIIPFKEFDAILKWQMAGRFLSENNRWK